MKWRIWVKWWFFPGVNLHARQRFLRLAKHFKVAAIRGDRCVLDAGSGNGMLAFQSWRRMNEVTGVSFKASEVHGCRSLFNGYLGIPQSELRFIEGNLYALDFPECTFDEIICSETLEHLRRDEAVCRDFWRLLKPGGVLHLCAPNAKHAYNASFPLDENETGGHVRPGYTLETYAQLLEPIGFRITESENLGGPIRQFFNRYIKETQARLGAWAGVPLFLIAQLFLPFELRARERAEPFSIYIRAVKPD